MNNKHVKIYLFTILPLLAGIVLILVQGGTLQPSSFVAQVKNIPPTGETVTRELTYPFATLLLEILVVLFVGKIIGYLFSRVGQQPVMGEILAGIILGPSLLGWLMPGTFQFIFPDEALANLQLLSQIGLVLFMFIIGMELDVIFLKNHASEAMLVGHLSIVFPYFLGVLLAYFLYPVFAPANVSFLAYALFIGIAMSITAFPVLARILKERNITKTHVGKMAIISAAVGDVSAWCILAVVIAIAKAGDISGAMLTILFTVVYVIFMFAVARPLLKLASEKFSNHGKPDAVFIALIFLTLLSSSLVAEVTGIHALFGAFLAGAVMPADVSLRDFFTEKTETISVNLLLPLFFAFTGLRTQIGLLNSPNLWVTGLLIIALAVAGKFIGSTAAAKLTGQSWKHSLSIGALMNTRGLMELIVLNIGYDLGILSPEIFTMMVFMALITTLMTSPTLNLIEKVFGKNQFKGSTK